MKKVLAILLTVILIISLTSCTGTNEYIAPTSANSAKTETDDSELFESNESGNNLSFSGITYEDAILAAKSISAGGAYTAGLLNDGTVMTKGLRELGSDYGPMDVWDWTDVTAIAGGKLYTIGLRSDGRVEVAYTPSFGKGCNWSEWTNITDVSVGGAHIAAVKSDGTAVATGDTNEIGQLNVEGWNNIIAISAGGCHTVGLHSDGTVVGTEITKSGYDFGQCDVYDWTNIVEISAGGTHTVGLRSDGTVVSTGYNSQGECNVDGWMDIVFISAGDNYTIGLRSDGTVVATGKNDYGQCDVDDWSGIVAVSAGTNHTVGLRFDGTVVATGSNTQGQCEISNWHSLKLPDSFADSISVPNKTNNDSSKPEYLDATAYINGDTFNLSSYLSDLGFHDIECSSETKRYASYDGGKTWTYITTYRITAHPGEVKNKGVLVINSATKGIKCIYPQMYYGSENISTSVIGYRIYGESNNDVITKATVLSTDFEGVEIEYHVALALSEILTTLMNGETLFIQDLAQSIADSLD